MNFYNNLLKIKNCFIPKFTLKADERVWVCVYTGWWTIKKATIKGFYVYGIAYEDHPYLNSHHYYNGLFYGYGYHGLNYAIVVRNRFLLPFAVICEKIRLFKTK